MVIYAMRHGEKSKTNGPLAFHNGSLAPPDKLFSASQSLEVRGIKRVSPCTTATTFPFWRGLGSPPSAALRSLALKDNKKGERGRSFAHVLFGLAGRIDPGPMTSISKIRGGN
jgi:hypothetical protein